jgi:hypothetical protein
MNLELPKGPSVCHNFSNSFAFLDSSSLMHKSNNAGISLCISHSDIENNINVAKDIEITSDDQCGEL